MKTLTSLLAGGALTLGTVMAQDAPKSATPAAAPAGQNQTQTKAKKHRRHKKNSVDKTGKTAAPASAAPAAAPATK
jgi:hypothetical protein